ncbi:MAG: N-acetylmuramoyl-L-alanine amidase [Firmicutes bacterium]|nr:N-acetylmuramoyl-L-alanine amidase [Bacillota bacterium]
MKAKLLWVILLFTIVLTGIILASNQTPKLEVYYPPFPALEFKPDYIPKTNQEIVQVEGKTDQLSKVWVQGMEAEVFTDGTFKATVKLVEGLNKIQIRAQNKISNESIMLERSIIRDTSPPKLVISQPQNGIFVNQERITVSGHTKPRSRVFVNGVLYPLRDDGSFEVEVSLLEGENFIYVAALDENLPNMALEVIQVTLDTIEPYLEIEFPTTGYISTEDFIILRAKTKPYATVEVEDLGLEALADKDGNFRLTLPLKEGRNSFYLGVVDLAGNWYQELIRIEKDTITPQIREFQPSGILAYSPGDILSLSVTGSEARCEASFTIDGKGPFPMTEVRSYNYSGVYRFQREDAKDAVSIEVSLTDRAGNAITRKVANVTVYDLARPLVAELYTPGMPAAIYGGPSSNYDRVCTIKSNAKVEITGRVGDYYKITPAKTFSAWTHRDNLRFLGDGIAPSKAVINSVSVTKSGETYTNVSFSLSEPVFYTITPLVSEPALLVTFYNTTSGVYNIAWRKDAEYVKLITPMQVTDDILQYRIDLKGNTIYGYDADFSGNVLSLKLKSEFSPFLDDKKVTIDPGHGPDSGAVGPTGLKERDLNLEIAMELKSLLEDAGCKVFLTRDQNYNYALGLYDRVDFAERYQTDLFVSIHNNAASNRSAHGTEAYYYTPFSQELSRLSVKYMHEHQGSEYRFYAHRSFAVIRQWTMPAILTEGDFVSNYGIEAWQKSGDFSTKNAEAIFMAIREFVQTYGYLD